MYIYLGLKTFLDENWSDALIPEAVIAEAKRLDGGLGAGKVILREQVRHATWVAMLFAIIGIAIMVINGFAAGKLVGNLSALLSATGFAVFTVALRWGKLEDMLPAVFMAGIFAMVIAASVCWIERRFFKVSLLTPTTASFPPG